MENRKLPLQQNYRGPISFVADPDDNEINTETDKVFSALVLRVNDDQTVNLVAFLIGGLANIYMIGMGDV